MYNRVHEFFSVFSAEDRRYDDYVEGFGNVGEGFVDNNTQICAGFNNANVVYGTQYKRYSRRFIPDRPIEAIERYSKSTEVCSNQVYSNHY